MNSRKLIPCLLVVLVVAFSSAVGAPPDDSPEKGRPTPRLDPPPPSPEPPRSQPYAPGPGMRSTQVDSTMQRMATIIETSQELSNSFAQLAERHHGADRSEVLMMQRMSDAMGAIAGEVKMSMAVYKKMLDDETASDTATMKVEVDNLKRVLDIIAVQVDLGIDMLQRLRLQLS